MHDTAHISALLRHFIIHMSCLTCYLASSRSSIFVLSWGTYKCNEVVTALAAVSDAWDSTRSAASVSQRTDCWALITMRCTANQLKTTESDVLFNEIQSTPCFTHKKTSDQKLPVNFTNTKKPQEHCKWKKQECFLQNIL